MNSKDYWAKREAEALKHRITDEAEYDKELKKIYANMLDACQKEIESFYAKYASQEGISLAEAKKRVSKHDVAAFERKAAKYVKDKDFSQKANEELRLYNATMKINRLEMLKANIGLETIAGHDELEKFMQGILQGRTEDELKRQAGILGKTVKNNATKAHAIVNGSFHNGTFSDRIWQYQDLMRQDLGRLLQQGLIQGKGARAIAKDLKKYWYGNDPKTGGGATYCMERLMRTELARVQTEAQKQSFIRNGFDMYEFICNHHASKHGTCDICKGLNGKHFKVSDMMPGENAPPIHPHCRCSTAAWVDDAEYEAWLDYLDQGGTTAEWNTAKMANDAICKNDWAETVGRQVSTKEKRKLISYAEENGITIPELNNFDGDPELLKAQIDALGAIKKKLPIGKNVTLTVSHSLSDKDFGSTTAEHITINAKALRNRKITEKNIAAGGQFASVTVEDIAVHEYGHVFSAFKTNKGLEIAGKAYYNIFGKEADDDTILDYLYSNVSNYSIYLKKEKNKNAMFNRRKYKEIIPEIFAKHNANPNNFTEEFIKLLKELN